MKTRKWAIASRTIVLVALLGLLGLPTESRLTEARTARPMLEAGAPGSSRVASLVPDEAVAAVLNNWAATDDGWRLRHPRHTATFTPAGLQFAPQPGGLEWAWRLSAVTADGTPLAGITVDAVSPQRDPAGGVAFHRGGLVEQYLAQKSAVEQRFLIPQPLPLGGAGLMIAGAVQCAGAFEKTEDGWLWRAEGGAVHLGNVRVYDAAGQTLPARMTVTAEATRIVVDGTALASAAYPVTVDPTIGANDFRISFMGRDTLYDAYYPAVAYNSHDNEYLVVWHGDDNSGSLADGENEIHGRRVDAATGALLGTDLRISNMGPNGNTAYVAYWPAVAYNSTDNQYLVVWYGDDDTAPLVDDEFEIHGQLLNADGNEVGLNDFRISAMGPDGDTDYDAAHPAVAYNSHDNEYLVVWQGDGNTGTLVNDEYEIFGQRLSATGGSEGDDDFRISNMGPDGDTDYDAYHPAVAYNSTDNEYLVVWESDDNSGSLVDAEMEIYGQRLSATGDSEGSDDFRISSMGPDGDVSYAAWYPAVAYNSQDNEYLVVWEGDDNTGTLVAYEYEIFGQRLSAAGGSEGSDDFRISNMGPDGDVSYGASYPMVAYNSTANQYLVVWHGDDDAPLVNEECESFGQLLNADGGSEGSDDFRISSMGPDGNLFYDAYNPAVAYNSTANQYLVVWYGDDDTAPLVDEEFEILGRRLSAAGDGLGTNDFRISAMGMDGLADAYYAAVAYNSADNEYLVVWYGDDGALPLVDDENEIWGQRVNAATGALIGAAFRISDMGPNGNYWAYYALRPAVAYNSADNEYLVVWEGADDTAPLVAYECEIFGQRLDADGAEVGDNDFRISDMGPNEDISFGAHVPAVAYNGTADEYLVVWSGNDGTVPTMYPDSEIYGQRLNAAGTEVGDNDFRISTMGSDEDWHYVAGGPDVAYNSTDKEYLVVWYGDDDTAPLVDDEFEIFGQRLDAAGNEVGDNDFRISAMGPDGDIDYDASHPAVAYNSTANEYLVVWEGDDSAGSRVDEEFEIFGQRLNADGGSEGTDDFRISSMGPNGDADYDALDPAVAYDSLFNEYLVVWSGDDDEGTRVDEEFEIFGQRLSAAGDHLGTNDSRLSSMGPNGDTAYSARYPAVAYSSQAGEYLVVWEGDDDTMPLVEDEFEIFGQRFTAAQRVYLPLIVRNYGS